MGRGRSPRSIFDLAAGCLLLGLPLASLAAAPPQEDPAERAYRLAADFLGEGKPELAAEALERFVTSFPGSDRVDDCLYLRATIAFPQREPEHLGRGHAAGAARARPFLERVRAEHPTGDRVAAAVYLMGLSHLVPDPIAVEGAGGYDAGRALALFREVLDVHPGSAVEAEALRGSALAEMRSGRPAQALLFLERLLLERPTGPLAAAARLQAADAWLRLGHPDQAMVALAPLADGAGPPVDAARDLLALMTRLRSPFPARWFRGDAGSPAVSGPVTSMVVDAAGRLHLLAEGGAAILRLARDGSVEDRRAVGGGRCLFREPGGGVGWASDSELHLPSGGFTPQRSDGGRARKVSGLIDVAQAPDGTFYLLEGSGKEVLRFAAAGSFAGVVAAARDAVALEVDRRGRVHVLDGKERTVATYLPDGTPSATFDLTGDGFDLRAPVDLAVDDAYHLYVLDGKGGFAVFGEGGDLRASVQPHPDGPDALRDPQRIVVEPDGAVLVFDGRGRVLRRFR